jgi:hypothetical protein
MPIKDARVKRGVLMTKEEYDKRFQQGDTALHITDEVFMYETAAALARLIKHLTKKPDQDLDDAIFDMEVRMGWANPPEGVTYIDP